MINSLSQWRKQHRDRTDFGTFKNKPHPIKKQKLVDRTIYRCLRCRENFTKFQVNKIKPPKVKVWKKDPSKKTDSQIWEAKLDKLWVKAINLRAGFRSELSKKAPRDFEMMEFNILDAHHIEGKSTLALRYSLENGVLITRKEHTEKAHGPADNQKEFKEWALGLRATDKHLIVGDFSGSLGCVDYEEVAFYLQENIKALKNAPQEEIYFP